MARTVTLGEELERDVEKYAAKLESETGKTIGFTRAFRIVMERTIETLSAEVKPS